MRWSIVRLIWLRELRDQLRDRRTLFMIVGLPILLYPLAGFGLLQLAVAFGAKPSMVGVVGAAHLPQGSLQSPSSSPFPIVAWWTVTPPPPGVALGGTARVIGAAALARARHFDPNQDYPPLLLGSGDNVKVAPLYLERGDVSEAPTERLTVRLLDDGAQLPPAPADLDGPAAARYLDGIDREPLDSKQVDLILVVPPDFAKRLEEGGRPPLFLLTRENDERSKLVNARLGGILARWKKHLKGVRLLHHGLPPDFDDPFEVYDRDRAKPSARRAAEDLFDMLVRIFPFVLVMWSLTGALYPAVDLCAGEKERGTMETLLISPASREEIVWGKFLTIWCFSAATALLNLLSMGLTTWQFSSLLSHGAFRPGALAWGVALVLPLSAFFSALCLAVGVYARSSKEGQYYLMPLFLLTMPLIFLTLAPGVELNPFYSMVPVTGVALLLQKLMAVGVPEWEQGLYLIPVLAPMVIYSWLALRWAIEQFQREEVLFREAERLDVRLWLRRLFREKELLPTTGEALCCFAIMLGLQWLSLSLGKHLSHLTRTAVTQLAFVATPPLFMTLLLTSWPRQGIALRPTPLWSVPLALILGVALVFPLAEMTLRIVAQFPTLKEALEENQPALTQLVGLGPDRPLSSGLRVLAFLILAVLPALCEELAFRGFLLTGLARRFHPSAVIVLSGFLYAIYPMNVFAFLPHFLFGAAMAFIVYRANSLVPAVLAHLAYNAVAFSPLLIPGAERLELAAGESQQRLGTSAFVVDLIHFALTVGGAAIALATLALFWRLSRAARRSGAFPTIYFPSDDGGVSATQSMSG